jgi:uncharacterized protein YbjT (DUF2867 family)
MTVQTVTVFGGTGFLGQRIIRHLDAAGFGVRVASRHPERVRSLFPEHPTIEAVGADINDESSTAAALAGAFAVVNSVSLYVERRSEPFVPCISKRPAGRGDRQPRQSWKARACLGDNTASDSPYIRSRGEGEAAVLRAFPAATLIRPAVMFGPDDAFLAPLLSMLRWLRVFPLFGRGETRL